MLFETTHADHPTFPDTTGVAGGGGQGNPGIPTWRYCSRGNAPGTDIFSARGAAAVGDRGKSETVFEGGKVLTQTPFATFFRIKFSPGKTQFRGGLSSQNGQNPLEKLLRFALF